MNKILLLILLLLIFIIQIKHKQNNPQITEPFNFFNDVGNFFTKDVGGAITSAVDTVGGGIQEAIKWATRLPGIFSKQIS